MRYEVKSELNPTYYKTFDHNDYYGLYHVVQVNPLTHERKILKTFDSKYDSSARRSAYEIVREFNKLEGVL